jgi:hypothetical protein
VKRGERTTRAARKKTVAAAPKKKLPYMEYNHPDHVRQRAEILEIAKKDAVWRCEGFAQYTIDQGYGALGPPDKKGNPRTWQQIGRGLFGEAMFNEAVKVELERRRALRVASGSSSSSPSPSLPSSPDSSLPPVDSYSLF